MCTCEKELITNLLCLNWWLQPCSGAGLYRTSYNTVSTSVYIICVSLNSYGFPLFCPTFSFSREHISFSHTHTGKVRNSEGDTAFYISEAFTLCRYWRVPKLLKLYIRGILVTLLMPVILKIKAFPQSPCDLMDLLAYKISTFQSLKPSYILVTWFSPDQQTAPCRCECFTGTWFCLGGTQYALHVWREKRRVLRIMATFLVQYREDANCHSNFKHSHNLYYKWCSILPILLFSICGMYCKHGVYLNAPV